MQRKSMRCGVGTAIACVGLLSAASTASAGGLDATFGVGGQALTPLSPTFGDRYLANAPAPDGGTYNVGYIGVDAADRAFVLTHTTATGALDLTFGVAGIAQVNVSAAPFGAVPNAPNGAPQASPTGTGELAQGVAVQPDGKIVVSGQAETPGTAGKPDGRDTDIYVARFLATGIIDSGFGVGGVSRIDLSDGMQPPPANPAATSTAVTGDAGYGVSVRPNGRILVTGGKGTDTATNATRTDRDYALVQLKADGTRDNTFGGAGVATIRTPGISENTRNGLLQPDGKFVGAAYGNVPLVTDTPTMPPATQQSPILFRFKADGTPDSSFQGGALGTDGQGKPGVATGLVGARGEAYGVVAQGTSYIGAGYGARVGSTNTDLISFRFNGDGSWDQDFGTDGLVTFAGAAGGNDRARNITGLADGRIAMAGHSEDPAAPNPVNSNGLVFVINPNGTPDTTAGPGGAAIIDFGGPGDFVYGVTAIGTKVTVSGYLGRTPIAGDDAAVARVDLTRPVVAPPPVAPPPVAPPPPPPVAPPPIAQPSKSAGRVSVSCTRTGKTKNRIRCTVTQSNRVNGTVRITLKRTGQKTLRGSARTTKSTGRATITISAKRKRAKYTATLAMPTPAGVTQTITRAITVK